MAKAKEEKFQFEEEQKPKKKSRRLSKGTKKKKKELHYYGPVEFGFNFLSLVIVIFIGIYYGYRSFYYYSIQNQKTKETAMTLNGLLLTNNKLMKNEEEGFHQDETGGYFFKGNVQNNYVWFANRMFRVLRVNEDDSVKLVTDDLVSSFMWGENSAYDNSNVRLWLTDVEKIKVSGVYYKTIPAQDRFVAKTEYTIDKMLDTKVEKGDVVFKDDIVTVTLSDYIEAGGKNSFLNNGKLYFILGYNEDGENLYIEEDGSIMSCDPMDGYGIRGVFTMKKNIPVSQGDGTKDNPYVIDQGNDTNYVDGYVKLGDDTWKVYEDNGEVIKMYLNGYIKVDGQEYVRNYSSYSSKFNYFEEDNIGHYLYNDYLNSLSYKNILAVAKFPYGELSPEVGYYYPNVYGATYDERIGMLNIFDYVSNNELVGFFRDNTGAIMSTTQYSVASNGLLEEAEVTDQKHIVPVIAIQSSSIKGGNGRIDNPYVVE